MSIDGRSADRNGIADRKQQKAIRINAAGRDGRICIDMRKMFCAFLLPLLVVFSNFVSLAAAGKLKHFNCTLLRNGSITGRLASVLE